MTHTTEQPELTAARLANIILSHDSRLLDSKVHIRIQSQGHVGGTPSVAAVAAQFGFDWDKGKFLITTAVPVTTLTQEQVADICTSVRKGGSWHAHQKWKAQQEEIQQLRARIAELEASQARVPLDYYTVSMAHLQIGAAGMLEATERIVRWTEQAHGITQEKQG